MLSDLAVAARRYEDAVQAEFKSQKEVEKVLSGDQKRVVDARNAFEKALSEHIAAMQPPMKGVEKPGVVSE